MKRVEDLELNLDTKFAARQRRFHRYGMCFLFAALLAAVLGFFGSGPFAEGELKSSEGAWSVKYKKFARFQAPVVMEARLSSSGNARQREFWINSAYLEAMKIEVITPQPSQVIAKEDMLGYFFLADDSAASVTVRFNMQPEKIGLRKIEVRGAKGEKARFHQWIYP